MPRELFLVAEVHLINQPCRLGRREHLSGALAGVERDRTTGFSSVVELKPAAWQLFIVTSGSSRRIGMVTCAPNQSGCKTPELPIHHELVTLVRLLAREAARANFAALDAAETDHA